ncbi:MAG TPA: hypothetical protein VE523_02680 [Solirubrobacterales bacterium]|nr:hypothetical protein [Solirubrobacterales bacterium]
MSSKLVKLIVIAVVIAGGLRIQVTRHRLAEQAGPSRDHAGPPPEAAAAQVSRPEPKAITRAPLYQEARRLGVRGRSKMPKAELKVALSEGGRA